MSVEATWRATVLAFMALTLLYLDLAGYMHPYTGVLGAWIISLLAFSLARAQALSEALSKVRFERGLPESTVEGVEVQATLRAENKSQTVIPVLIVEDTVPPRMRPRGRPWARASLAPGGEALLSWRARPAPGYHLLQELQASAGDPLWLFYTTRRVPLVSSITVYPLSIGEIEASHGGVGASEPRRSRLPGWGLEFYSLREYVPGDDVRLVHWPTSARAGKPMVREGLREEEARIAVFVDLSLYSWAGPPGDAPADWIMRTAMSIALSAARSGGRIAYLVSTGEVWSLQYPERASVAAESLRRRLALTGPSKASHRIGLGRQVRALVEAVPRGYRVVVLLAPLPPLYEVIEALQGRGSLVAVYTPWRGGRWVEEARRRNASIIEHAEAPASTRLILVDSPSKAIGVVGEALEPV